MQTVITRETIDTMAQQHALLCLRRTDSRVRGDCNVPDCLDLPKGFARVKWVNGSITVTDMPLVRMAAWAKTFKRDAEFRLAVDDKLTVTLETGNSYLQLLSKESSTEDKPVTEPVITVNCDDPRAKVEPIPEAPEELKQLKQSLAASRKTVRRNREIYTAQREVKQAYIAVRRCVRQYVAARKLHADAAEYSAQLQRSRKARDAKRLARKLQAAVLWPVVGPKQYNVRNIRPDCSALRDIVVLTETERAQTDNELAAYRAIPDRFANKKADVHAGIVNKLLAEGNEAIKQASGGAAYSDYRVHRMRKTDPYTLRGGLYFNNYYADYMMARRTIRRYAVEKDRLLCEFRESVYSLRSALR